MALDFYHGHGSPFSWRVHLALEHKKIPHILKVLSFQNQDTKKPEFKAVNPRGERLTQHRLAELLTPASGMSAQAWLDGIIAKVSAHADGEAFPDDVAAFAAVRR